MIWLLSAICFVPLFFLPRVIYNAFSLPQIFALGLLSSLGVIIGVANGLVSLAAPCLFAILFLAYMVISITWTTPTHNGVKELGLQAPLIFLFLLGSSYITLANSSIIALSIAITAALISLYAYGQTKGIDWFFPNNIKKGGDPINAIGTTGNTNFLSGYLVSAFWISVYACASIHWGLIFLPALCGYALYLTKSRAGMIGMAGSVLFITATSGFMGYLPFGPLFPVALVGAFIFLSCFIVQTIIVYWEPFWNKEIDPKGDQVWYATLRYRFCYWLSALQLIKEKPFFGWGMWTFRREVYKAQAKINEKHPNFLNPRRYITPQPREVHNDYLEHLVEFGFVGASIFGIIVVLVYKIGFGFLLSQTGLPCLLMLLLLTNLTGILFNIIYFFALRVPSSGINFWLTCAMIIGIASPTIASFSLGIVQISIIALILAGFFWNCIAKRFIASYYFSKYGQGGSVDRASKYLVKTLKYAPYDTLYRTYAMSLTMSSAPEVANYHAEVITSHFDGMSPLWLAFFNRAVASLKDTEARFNTPIFYLENSLKMLPESFDASHEFLNGPKGIKKMGRLTDTRRESMKEVSQEVQWQMKAFESEKQNAKLTIENMQLKANQMNMQQQQILMQEKQRLNIPNDWVFNLSVGQFLSPEDNNKLSNQQGMPQQGMPQQALPIQKGDN